MFRHPRFYVLVGIGLLALVACQADVPTQVDTDREPSIEAAGPMEGVSGLKGPSSGSGHEEWMLVKVRGGAEPTVADAVLSIVPGSIPVGTKITITPQRTGYMSFVFGPSGLTFDRPAVLTISTVKADLRGIDPSRLRIAGASNQTDDWQVVGGIYDPLTRTVVAPISHFSRYALCVN